MSTPEKETFLSRCRKIPLEKATKPRDGDVVMVDRWWVVVDGCILFYQGFAAQCNSNKEITERLRDKLYPGAEVRFLPMVFAPNRQ